MSAMWASRSGSPFPRKEAEEFIDAYFARYPKVLEYQQSLLARVRKTGEVETLLGRKRRLDPAGISAQPRLYQSSRAGRAPRRSITRSKVRPRT